MSAPHEGCEFRMNGLRKYLVGVAVAVTTALVGQSMALVWWAGAITTRVQRVEKDVDGLSTRVHSIETGPMRRP